ncbi:MAG TPA: hypothetical protein VM846_03435 [Vicinamibacterales bacterium]|jgi:hypothetical protein|nr:hypothetical protein [Vicinamibacterales bacterium]
MDATPVGALYDSLLQSALRQFFERATFDAEPTATGATDARLAIEPSANPAALIIRWFGTRYTLRVPTRWPFTAHEVRLAQAIGFVLAARYRAIQNPRILAERVDLFSGAIEDRYVGAFLDPRSYAIDARESRADRIASIIEMLRVAALSSYENRPISTGVMLLGTSADPMRPGVPPTSVVVSYDESLARIKSFFRLAEGVHTLFLASSEGRLLNIIDIRRWASGTRQNSLTPRAFQPHARATLQHGHVCAVLSPSREIKIFAEGTEMFTFRGAAWHLVDAQAKYRIWADAVGDEALAGRIFQTARDLSDAREGALFVVVREPDVAVPQLVAPADRLDLPIRDLDDGSEGPSRRHLLHLLERRTITDLDPSVFMGLAALDGATVTDRSGRLLAVGAILRHPPSQQLDAGGGVEGARTTAAMAASQFGPVLKVSEDGILTFFDRDRVWDI